MLFTILLVGVLLLILAIGLCKKENFVNMGNLKPKIMDILKRNIILSKWHSFYSQSNQDRSRLFKSLFRYN